MIGKICDLCGKMYAPYGSVVDQEDVVVDVTDILSEEQTELIDPETLDPNEPDGAAYQEPEENGFRFLTIDPYGTVQYEHDKYDLCPDCMGEIKDLIEELKESQGS